MATNRRTNIVVYVVARILTGICSFLGFQGPTWARQAIDARHEPIHTAKEEELPALGRAAASMEHPAPQKKATRSAPSKVAKPRRAGAKKASKKIVQKTARERTESYRSSL